MTERAETPPETRIAAQWIAAFGNALEGEPDESALLRLFIDDSHWRDLVALTWDTRQVSGRSELVDRLISSTEWATPRNFRLAPGYSAPSRQSRTRREVIEAFFEFDVAYGSAVGLVRLIPDDQSSTGVRAWMLLTQIESVAGSPSVRGGERPGGVGYDKQGGRVTWASRRAWKQAFADREPDVLIVGGGQAGVMLAAHLNRLGVDNLVVDTHARVGDNWRTRYDSLQLHNQTHVVQFPYLPFPSIFPEYIPKDKLANWFEDYVDALEINFWTSTSFIGARYDADSARWNVELNQDGQSRTLHPRHLVMTTGGTGVVPNIPDLPGIESFSGAVLHSKDFVSGSEYSGKRVLVVGAGTSAHDIAYNLDLHGAAGVTMLQRGAVTVTSLESANDIFGLYSTGIPVLEADTISALGWVGPVQRETLQAATKRNNERDRDLLAGLTAGGLRLDDGEDHTGWVRKFISRGGGYYIDVGGSQLIIDGRVKVLQADGVDRFEGSQLIMCEGASHDFDAVIMATGFKNQETATREQLGEQIADRIGRIGGYDEEREVKNTWRPTAQPGLWFGSGSFQYCRTFSPLLAMQLRAELSGLAPSHSDRSVFQAAN
ncbi:flavin-containing monooxygenase [Arthrobacter sp. MMS18-M83]|uniref:flavin-containing monooxygenase n=1 Tax=Arthrobacter sp. MMS18-M83 TaxID=2996261 RepID=UPI00227AD283|nr:NAD(P)/FAD-dependent oxidoreductase [Arthrobacter sp. MMS18-M83]WAH97640.1 NAD(P)/FAD-dependent oxidoreductase [Arthrobacter sp. MMS18-M83]